MQTGQTLNISLFLVVPIQQPHTNILSIVYLQCAPDIHRRVRASQTSSRWGRSDGVVKRTRWPSCSKRSPSQTCTVSSQDSHRGGDSCCCQWSVAPPADQCVYVHGTGSRCLCLLPHLFPLMPSFSHPSLSLSLHVLAVGRKRKWETHRHSHFLSWTCLSQLGPSHSLRMSLGKSFRDFS